MAVSQFIPGYSHSMDAIIPKAVEGQRRQVIDLANWKDTFDRVENELKDANGIKLVREPTVPSIRSIPVKEPYNTLATKLGMDPLDLEHIMVELGTTSNDALLKAFKQFVMIAKLSVEHALLDAERIRKDVEHTNATNRERYQRDLEDVRGTNARTVEIKKDAEAAVRKEYLAFVNKLEKMLSKDNTVATLSWSDQCVIEALRGKYGKKTAVIRAGKVTVDFKLLKSLKSEQGKEIIKEAQRRINAYTHDEIYKWVNDRKNVLAIGDLLQKHEHQLGQNKNIAMTRHEYNDLMRIWLGHMNRIAIIRSDGNVEDGGPYTKGEPKVIWEERDRWSGGGSYSNSHYPLITQHDIHKINQSMTKVRRRALFEFDDHDEIREI